MLIFYQLRRLQPDEQIQNQKGFSQNLKYILAKANL